MTWKRKELVSAGKLNPPMGLCPECGADLIPRLVNRNRECYYVCSRVRCKHEKRPVPPSSSPYGGPK